MASSSDESRATTPSTEVVSSSAEGELVIDEDDSTVSLAANPRVASDLTVAVRKGEECIPDFLDQLSDEDGVLSRFWEVSL